MTTHYYGVSLGGRKATDVTKDTSTTSLTTELAVVSSTSTYYKEEVLLQIEAIKQKILEDTWPPT